MTGSEHGITITLMALKARQDQVETIAIPRADMPRRVSASRPGPSWQAFSLAIQCFVRSISYRPSRLSVSRIGACRAS